MRIYVQIYTFVPESINIYAHKFAFTHAYINCTKWILAIFWGHSFSQRNAKKFSAWLTFFLIFFFLLAANQEIYEKM